MLMATQTPVMTPAEFDTWVARPENTDRLFELIGSNVVEKHAGEDGTMVAHFDASEIAQLIGFFLRRYLMTHPIGRLSGADGGFAVGAQRYIPDVGFIRHDRFPADYSGGYVAATPDLAVEVISANDREPDTLIKLSNYLAAGCVVWIVYPQLLSVQVHTPGQAAQVLSIDDTLTGDPVLPGFTIAVRECFSPLMDSGAER